KELGVFAGDKIAEWRASNLAKVYIKFKEKYEGLSLPSEAISRLPFGIRALFVEEASKVESSDLQELWATLLVSSIEAGAPIEFENLLIDLRKLTPLSVKVLLLIQSQPREAQAIKRNSYSRLDSVFSSWAFDADTMLSVFSESDKQIEAAFSNLIRLQLVRPSSDVPDVSRITTTHFEAEELAVAISRLIEEYVALPTEEPEREFMRSTNDSGENVLFFRAEVSNYGYTLLEYCLMENK
ncbi:MAG: hypothetical protein AAFQ15_17930, partial [Pseudomonadota bacterium]